MSTVVTFSPPAGIAAAIKAEIDAASTSIKIAMYHFTEPSLAAAMAAAVVRGVGATAILDFKGAYQLNSMSWQLSRSGVHVYTDAMHSQMHEKFAVIDSFTVLHGTANWSANSDGASADYLIVSKPDSPLASVMLGNWQIHLAHSIPLPR